MKHPVTLSGAIAFAILASLSPMRAMATLTAPTTAECRSGEYVVGLEGRTGLWIDAVGPVCAGWDEKTAKPTQGRPVRPVGGRGGGANRQLCPHGSAISGWRVASIVTDSAAFADQILFQCRTLAPPHDISTREPIHFGGQNELRRGKGGPRTGQCPQGQLAVSVSAWRSSDGQFVTDVNLRCASAPIVYGRH